VSDFRPDQSPVRNQGDRPTCVAFATSAAHEWAAGEQPFRSTEDAMWAAHQVGGVPGREEVTVTWALTGLRDYGHAAETAWPYGQPRWSDGRPHAARDAVNRRALPKFRLLPDTTFEAVAAALDSRQPVVLTVRVVRSSWRNPDGIIDAEPGRKTPGNHAVLAAGALTGPDRIIIKNSWGPSWGDRGYGYLTRRYLASYALRAHALELT
jgi:hypothetical protein